MTEISYEALYNEVAVYAAALKKLGIQKGDRVVGKKSVTLLILMDSLNTKAGLQIYGGPWVIIP